MRLGDEAQACYSVANIPVEISGAALQAGPSRAFALAVEDIRASMFIRKEKNCLLPGPEARTLQTKESRYQPLPLWNGHLFSNWTTGNRAHFVNYHEKLNPSLWVLPGVFALHLERGKQQTGTHQRCQKLAGAGKQREKNTEILTSTHWITCFKNGPWVIFPNVARWNWQLWSHEWNGPFTALPSQTSEMVKVMVRVLFYSGSFHWPHRVRISRNSIFNGLINFNFKEVEKFFNFKKENFQSRKKLISISKKLSKQT